MPADRNNKVSCHHYTCEIEIAMEVLGGKWKALIIWNLGQREVIRYNTFRTLIPGISQKMLTQQLRLLEDELIVERTVYPEVPPVVEYRLTDLGKELLPILSGMDQWGKKFVKAYEEK